MAKTTKAVTSDKKVVPNSDVQKSWKMSKQKKIVLGSFLV
jgi:hypothetical protein